MNGVLRLGAIGAGAVFAAYARAAEALRGVRLDAILDIDPTRRSTVSASGRRVYTSIEQFLEEPLDAVLVLAPNGCHASLVEACLIRRVDTLCEKPLATTVAEARRLLAMAETSGVFLYTAMHCRHRPEVRAFAASFSGGIIQFDQVYRENWLRAPAWYFDPAISGGGVLLDVGINQIDWILPFVGALEIEDVAMARAGASVELECRVTWRHSRGRGSTDLSWRAHPERKTTRIVTDAGLVFELDHRRHALWRDGHLQGIWLDDEYVGVLTEFLQQRREPQTRQRSNAAELLALLRSVYANAGFPFLADDGPARLQEGDGAGMTA